MAQFQKDFYQDLNQNVKIRQCGTIVFSGDNESNIITVSLFDGQNPAPQSGSVACYVVRSDGKTVPTITGSISGNVVSATLTEACFTRPGPIGVGIQVIDGTVKTTVLKAVYNVETLYTDEVIDPEGEITLSVGDLVQRIDDAVASIPADYSDLLAAIAPAYTDLTFPVSAGTWCWYNGGLYRAKVDIPASETWTADHWETAPLSNALAGDVEDLKSAVFQSASMEWTQGIYNWNTGTEGTSTARIRSSKVTKSGLVKALCEAGFTFTIHAWNGETYIGNLKTNGTFATGSSSVKWITEYSFAEAPNYTYAFVMQKTSGNATPEDGDNFILEYDNVAMANGAISSLSGTVNGISVLANQNGQEISLFNSGDLCAHPSGDASTGETDISGVTFTKAGDDRYHVSGTNTGSSSAQFRLYISATALPNGVIPGETYYADYYSDSFGCKLQILTNGSSSSGFTTLLDHRRGGEFTVPSDAKGMIIRLSIGAGVSVDTIVRPRIFSVKSLQYAQLHKEKNTRPMLSIVYDDGFKDFDTYIMPIVRQKKIPIATAIIPEAIPVHDYLMTWEEIQACYADGAEVLPHFGAYSEAEWAGFGSQDISWRYYKTLNALRAHSIYTPDVLVFSGSSSQYTITRVAARRIFNAGFNASNGGINYYGKFDPYYINRYSADNKTLDALKAWIDELVAANDGWMVWTRHNGSDYVYGQDAAYAAQVLSDAIDYALSKGVQIVTVERGLNEYLDM